MKRAADKILITKALSHREFSELSNIQKDWIKPDAERTLGILRTLEPTGTTARWRRR